MTKFTGNLKARGIKMTRDEIHMVQRILSRQLKGHALYRELPMNIQSIIKSNVLIVAASDSLKHADNKADVMIGNLREAAELVFKDISAGTLEALEEV